MKKLSPALVFGFLGLATFASLVGTVSGTLAWYAYNSRTSISYSGTSVENVSQLQIGLQTDSQMPHIDGDPFNEAFWEVMTEEEGVVPGTYFYFAPLGFGLDSTVINAYLGVHGYATSELCPVTSGYYDPTDPLSNFSLEKNPTTTHHAIDLPADTKNFIRLPLIFRVSKSKTTLDEYAEGQELWITDAKGAASSASDGNVYKAMRVFFDRKDADYDRDFILNPEASSAGSTKVGGVLDLSADGYYDFDENGEFIYGDWDESVLADPSTKLSESGYVAPGGEKIIYDLNNDGTVVDKGDSFKSAHNPGTKYYDYESLNGIPFKTAKYESLNSIKPYKNPTTGQLTNQDENNPTSLCMTAGAEGKYVGSVDAYIWLEGWDFAVIDEEQEHAFDFGLTFEINKAGDNS